MSETISQKPSEQPGASPSCAAAPGSDPLVECVQCGQLPADLEEEYQPKIIVLAENFGEPYLFGVHCMICGRVAKGVGREAAVKRWQDGGHDGDLDEFGNENTDE